MDTHTVLQTINFIILFISIIILPININKLKTNYHKYGAYSIYLWLVHAFIFYFAIMTNRFPYIFEYIKLKPIEIFSSWPSIIIWQIIITLVVKEYLKIKFLNGEN
jgi:magnesium-transporting ATPase (P-type)